VTLDEALAQADFISLHMPFNKKEPALIGKEQFKKMKKGVFIVNVARGGIVCESALLDALNDGTVAMAALDVWFEEPTKNDALAKHPKVLALPHLGASTAEGQSRVGTAAAEIAISSLKK
jgi:D-3-phosphoglycerate dehydrogenase